MKNKKSGKIVFDPNDVPAEALVFSHFKQQGIPVGLDTYNRVVEKYPEHFPEEYAHKKKWESIPQEVKDAYFKECSDLRNQLYKDVPYGGGIVAWMNMIEEHLKWQEAYNKIRPIEMEREKELHEKYFSKYGI